MSWRDDPTVTAYVTRYGKSRYRPMAVAVAADRRALVTAAKELPVETMGLYRVVLLDDVLALLAGDAADD